MVDFIGKLRMDVDALEKIAKEIDWFAKPLVKTRILMIREDILQAIKKLKEPTEDLETQNKLWNSTKPSAQYRLECEKCGTIIKIPKDVIAIDPCSCGGYFKRIKRKEEDETIIGTGSISDQEEFNKVKKWENKKD